MKLVDILALELKEWPEGVSGIEQDRRGSCLYQYTGPAISAYVESVADDADSAVVTRAQWQAAVDALKAADSVIPTPSDEATEAWLVGLEIPYGLEAAQACREIINNHKRKRDEAIEIQKIRDEIKWQKPQLGPCPVEQMYLLGYRKFEIVDN